MVVKQLDAQPVADHRGLTDGDIGKRPRVDQHRLMLHRIAQGGVDGIAHPRRHGARYLQILRGDGTALLVVGQHDIPDAAAQIGQIPRHGQDGHQFGADGDVGAGVHGVAVHFPVAADVHFPQRLTAEVQHEAPLYPRRVDVQTAQSPLGQLCIVVVALVLHPGIQRRHGQIVGVHDVVDVPGKAERKLGHGDEQGVAAPGGGALYVHGRPAGGLTQTAAHVFPQPSQSLDQPQRRGGFSLTQRRGGDGGDLDIFAVRTALQPLHDADKVQLRRFAVGDQLLRQQTQPLAESLHRRKLSLRCRADLPILVNGGIQHDPPFTVRIAAVCKSYLHAASSPAHSVLYYTQHAAAPSITHRPRYRIFLLRGRRTFTAVAWCTAFARLQTRFSACKRRGKRI